MKKEENVMKMGCGFSRNEQPISDNSLEDGSHITLPTETARKGLKPTETIKEAYQRLDEEICQLEEMCPGPRLSTTEAWIEYLESHRVVLEPEVIELTDEFDETDEATSSSAKMSSNFHTEAESHKNGLIKVRNLANQMGIAMDIGRAERNEEFMASVSRSYMNEYDRLLHNELIEHAKERKTSLVKQFNELKYKYAEHDGLLVSVNGGSYMTKTEQQLDQSVEASRLIRDKLGATVELWRSAANFLRTSARSAFQACENWGLAGLSKNPTERIVLATDCRTALQDSLKALDAAHKVLPQVELKPITQRQISAVHHANLYLLTDMANPKRYQHTKNVIESYQNNVDLALKWIHETFVKTLKKDFEEAENSVLSIAKRLRQERISYLNHTAIGNEMYIQADSLKVPNSTF